MRRRGPARATRLTHRRSPSTRWRARRFDLSLPVWFRAAGETLWHNGVTQSVSTDGAVIRADGPAPSSEPVIVVIVLPSVAGCLVGRGRVVRTVLRVGDSATAADRVDRGQLGQHECDRCFAVTFGRGEGDSIASDPRDARPR